MTDSQPALKKFFGSEHFAVAGASKDPAKIGNKVVKWYKSHGLSTIPINPREASVEDIDAVASVSDLPDQKRTSLSIITPPSVSFPIVKTSLLELGLPYVWLQPGAEGPELSEWLETQPQEIKDRVILGGPCILVLGENLAREQGKL